MSSSVDVTMNENEANQLCSTFIKKNQIMIAVSNYMVHVFKYPRAISNEILNAFLQYLELIRERYIGYLTSHKYDDSNMCMYFDSIIAKCERMIQHMDDHVVKNNCFTEMLRFIMKCDNMQMLSDIEVFVSPLSRRCG